MVPTSTDIVFRVQSQLSPNVGAIALFIAQGETAPAMTTSAPSSGATSSGNVRLGAALARAAQRLVDRGLARGKLREVACDLIDHDGVAVSLFLTGLGPAQKVTAEQIRQGAAAVARVARKQRIGQLVISLPVVAGLNEAEIADAVVTGTALALFDFQEYKGAVSRRQQVTDGKPRKSMVVTILAGPAQVAQVKRAVESAQAICAGQNFARTIASRPGNVINPPALAKIARSLARDTGLACCVFDEKQLARMGMGGILGVGAGSIAAPPRLIVLEHRIAKAQKSNASRIPPLLIVGKAITFDTGGISIKPAEKMGKMIFDKCGGMAVLGLMYALAELNLNVPVVGILSSAENAISSKAYRPGDILTMYNGVTVEVTNTDAEGRLVLGDALAWGIETYRPAAVVDLATLTGGVIVALGKSIAGAMSNSDSLMGELQEASKAAGEAIWRLPLFDEHREFIKSDVADIVNSAGREGHPLQGGAFISCFIPEDGSVPWAHLDIAGVADTEKDAPYYSKGATGWGVRTLVNWVIARAGANQTATTLRAYTKSGAGSRKRN